MRAAVTATAVAMIATLFASAGCLSVTGVGDYTVDDDSGSVNSGCANAGSSSNCIDCCAIAHPVEKRKFDDFFACVCQPGFCDQACAPDFCQDPFIGFSDACLRCLNAAASSACPYETPNAYAVCFSGCPSS